MANDITETQVSVGEAVGEGAGQARQEVERAVPGGGASHLAELVRDPARFLDEQPALALGAAVLAGFTLGGGFAARASRSVASGSVLQAVKSAGMLLAANVARRAVRGELRLR